MRPRPILHRIGLDADTHFPVITQRNTDVMWVDQSEGLIGDRLMVKSIRPIFFYRVDLEKIDLHQNPHKISIQERVDVGICPLGPVLGTQTP